jgi:aminoglycoside phosphotransferase family enzyme/predicted kinase
MSDDQTATLALLAVAAGDTAAPVIETHISFVVLGRDTVFKLKRAIRLPYLDFSTAERRLAACEAEVALNRRTAPGLYRGVRRITRDADGRLALDGGGELVDACVEMARFDEETLFDRLAERDGLPDATLEALAAAIAGFHDAAAVDRTRSGSAVLAEVLDINERGFATSTVFPPSELDPLLAAFRRGLAAAAPMLDARGRADAIRRCHGDLHLRNICLVDGRPTLFDCLEFDEAMATTDVLYDLAFVVMDLWHRGRRAAANLVVNRYADARGEGEGLALMPFLMAVRAAVRAHVAATRASECDGDARRSAVAEARRYFDLAGTLLAPVPPRLVAIGGRSGTGKSTIAAMVAADIGAPPGARILSSDRTRKRLLGVAPTTRLPAEAYRPEMSERVYAAVAAEAAVLIAAGVPVIAESVFDREADRARIAAAGTPFTGIWLSAATPVRAARVAARTNDPSDATPEIAARQAGLDTGAMAWTVIDAEGTAEAVSERVRRALAIPS